MSLLSLNIKPNSKTDAKNKNSSVTVMMILQSTKPMLVRIVSVIKTFYTSVLPENTLKCDSVSTRGVSR